MPVAETVGWHHRLNRHEFEQALGDGETQGNLVCCSSWGHKESDRAKQLNKNKHTLPCVKWIAGWKLLYKQGTQRSIL